MVFITYSDLNNDVVSNLHRIPGDVDLVVGVPRSGLLVASIIALYINKPLSDIESFVNHKILSVGKTKNNDGNPSSFDDIKKVLVVEDSINSGNSIIEVKNQILEANMNIQVVYLAAYIRSSKKKWVDIWFECIDDDRVFEWNYMQNLNLSCACVDIDGVLCVDPTEEQNDDGERYKDFLKNAIPLLHPTERINCIVSSRLNKYRFETEQWLSEHGIQYNHLYLMDVESAEERRLRGNHGRFKAKVFKDRADCKWFIESDPLQAEYISGVTGKLVFCTLNQTKYNAGKKEAIKNNLKTVYPRIIGAKMKRILPRSVKSLFRKIKRK